MTNDKPSNVGKRNAVGMTHWNGNLVCSIDTETTGLNPEIHEIVELAILPCNRNFEIHPVCPPFILFMRPDRLQPSDTRPPGWTEAKMMNYYMNGVDQARGADLFIEWFEKLNLGQHKKIMPLAHNWPFDRSMLVSWLGDENYKYIFHGFTRDIKVLNNALDDGINFRDSGEEEYRDTMMITQAINDAAELQFHPDIPHPKHGLGSLCHKYGVKLENAHAATDDAEATMKVWAQMVKGLRF